MDRRNFIKLSGMGATMASLPLTAFARPIEEGGIGFPMDKLQAKKFADVALNAARSAGATYTDVRIGRYLNQYVITREDKVQNIVNTESYGVGIRVIANGTWGFSASNTVNEAGIKKASEEAVAIARANSKYQKEPVQLVPVAAHGEVSWKTPIKKNAFEIPIKEKVDMLLEANARAMEAGASYINNMLFLVNEQKYFASSDGSYIDQDIHRIWPNFNVTVIDQEAGKFKSRQALSSPMGMGFEYLDGLASEKVAGPAGTVLYRNSFDMVEDAVNAARQAKESLGAKSVDPGKYSLVLDPSHLWLTIHESVGHPLELDRVLGYEANYAGTSFATLDKWKAGDFNYGSEKVNLFADKTQPYSLGAVGYDDEGVKCKKWDLVKGGVLKNYQAIRDQAHIIGEKESHGCCYADNWSSVQFQRMPNVSLAPGTSALSVQEMIKDVEKGIFIIGDGSYSIDQQRYNFQFGGQLFYEIENGEVKDMLRDVAYQSNTQEFWNSCSQICDEKDFRMGGSFFDGKGQPGQVSSVSHGSATSRFDNINVINTDRKI